MTSTYRNVYEPCRPKDVSKRTVQRTRPRIRRDPGDQTPEHLVAATAGDLSTQDLVMRMSRRRPLERNWGKVPWLTLVLLVTSLTTILAIVSASSAAAQARFAALPLEAPAPADNPTTPERVALGRLLFWDPILSGQKDVACATCHHPDFGYSDGLDLSIGANGVGLGAARAFAAGHPPRLVKRNSQTVLNVAFNGLTSAGDSTPAAAPMFWDLRVRSLEAQALEPLKALEEMRGGAYPEDRAHCCGRRAADRHCRVPPAVCARVWRRATPSTKTTSGARSRRFSGRSWPRIRRSIATCAATQPR